MTLPLCGGASDWPQLIVIISIDQMRADHLTRYASLYEQGFKRMTTEEVFFKNGISITRERPPVRPRKSYEADGSKTDA